MELKYYFVIFLAIFLNYVGKALLYLVGLVVVYLTASYLLPFITVNNGKENSAEKTKMIHLDGNGVHIDYVFAREDLPASFVDLLAPDPKANYVAFGWGDQGFYLKTPTWAELKPSVAIKAMILPSPTAMHVTDHVAEVEDWRPVYLTPTQMSELVEYVKEAFKWKGEELLLIPDASYGDNDRFYQAMGNYHSVYTCNTWINSGLKQVGVRIGIWSSNQFGVLRYFPEG